MRNPFKRRTQDDSIFGNIPKLSKAYELFAALFPLPKDHREWAEGFNVREKIRQILIKEP